MSYRQGRFSFRYVNFLGYRKGADGQPEIHPEEALHHAILEAIRSLIQNRQKDWQPIWKTLCWIVSPIIWMNFPRKQLKTS